MSVRFAIVCLALSWSGCFQNKSTTSSNASKRVPSTQVQRQDLDFTLDVIGDLRPSVQVDVKAEVSGRVKTLPVTLGQTVKRGDLLVELDDTDLLTEKSSTQVEIDGSRLQVKKANLAADRARQLVAEKLIPQQEADNLLLDAEIARNALDRAKKKLQSVEDKLSKTRIVAPLDGAIIALPIVEGQVVVGGPSVSTGTLLMTIAKLSEMLISTHVNQIDVTRMKVGHSVEVSLDAFEQMKIHGKICFIAPVATIKNNIKGFGVDILVANPDPRIRPGMSANVQIPIAKVDQALSVPIEAIFNEDGRRVVYLKNKTGVERREVEVGLVTSERAEIKNGVKEGETILLVRPEKIMKG